MVSLLTPEVSMHTGTEAAGAFIKYFCVHRIRLIAKGYTKYLASVENEVVPSKCLECWLKLLRPRKDGPKGNSKMARD